MFNKFVSAGPLGDGLRHLQVCLVLHAEAASLNAWKAEINDTVNKIWGSSVCDNTVEQASAEAS